MRKKLFLIVLCVLLMPLISLAEQEPTSSGVTQEVPSELLELLIDLDQFNSDYQTQYLRADSPEERNRIFETFIQKALEKIREIGSVVAKYNITIEGFSVSLPPSITINFGIKHE